MRIATWLVLASLGCSAPSPVASIALGRAKQARPVDAAPTWATTVGRAAPEVPAPPSIASLEATAGGLPVGFRVDTPLDRTWPRWRAAIEAAEVGVEVVDEGPFLVIAQLTGRGEARGYVTLREQGGVVHGALGWVRAPRPLALSGPCVTPPSREVHVRVVSREANPPPDREEPREVPWIFRTERAFDVDDDGVLDVVVPTVAPGDCPHEVEHEIFVMRGSCGHSVGVTLGYPRLDGPARPGRLRDLRTERRWAAITDPERPGGPSNVATLHEVTTRYVARRGRYRPEPPVERAGICHHCGMPSCRIVSGP